MGVVASRSYLSDAFPGEEARTRANTRANAKATQAAAAAAAAALIAAGGTSNTAAAKAAATAAATAAAVAANCSANGSANGSTSIEPLALYDCAVASADLDVVKHNVECQKRSVDFHPTVVVHLVPGTGPDGERLWDNYFREMVPVHSADMEQDDLRNIYNHHEHVQRTNSQRPLIAAASAYVPNPSFKGSAAFEGVPQQVLMAAKLSRSPSGSIQVIPALSIPAEANIPPSTDTQEQTLSPPNVQQNLSPTSAISSTPSHYPVALIQSLVEPLAEPAPLLSSSALCTTISADLVATFPHYATGVNQDDMDYQTDPSDDISDNVSDMNCTSIVPCYRAIGSHAIDPVASERHPRALLSSPDLSVQDLIRAFDVEDVELLPPSHPAHRLVHAQLTSSTASLPLGTVAEASIPSEQYVVDMDDRISFRNINDYGSNLNNDVYPEYKLSQGSFADDQFSPASSPSRPRPRELNERDIPQNDNVSHDMSPSRASSVSSMSSRPPFMPETSSYRRHVPSVSNFTATSQPALDALSQSLSVHVLSKTPSSLSVDEYSNTLDNGMQLPRVPQANSLEISRTVVVDQQDPLLVAATSTKAVKLTREDQQAALQSKSALPGSPISSDATSCSETLGARDKKNDKEQTSVAEAKEGVSVCNGVASDVSRSQSPPVDTSSISKPPTRSASFSETRSSKSRRQLFPRQLSIQFVRQMKKRESFTNDTSGETSSLDGHQTGISSRRSRRKQLSSLLTRSQSRHGLSGDRSGSSARRSVDAPISDADDDLGESRVPSAEARKTQSRQHFMLRRSTGSFPTTEADSMHSRKHVFRRSSRLSSLLGSGRFDRKSKLDAKRHSSDSESFFRNRANGLVVDDMMTRHEADRYSRRSLS